MKWNILHIKEDCISYAYPILKIVVCIAVIILFINRNSIIRIDSNAVNIIAFVFTGRQHIRDFD